MSRTLDEILSAEKQASVHVVRFLVEDVIVEPEADLVGDQLVTLLHTDEQPRLVLDMEKLTHVSSVMLSALIEAHHASKKREGRIALAQLQPTLKNLFETVRIDHLFEIYASTESAVAALLD